jgi:hypothetical protein
MLKQYNIRLLVEDIKKVDKLGGNRSEHIRSAIRSYIQPVDNNYNQDLVNVLKDQITDLKGDKEVLQRRLDYYMLPWYKRLLLPSKK